MANPYIENERCVRWEMSLLSVYQGARGCLFATGCQRNGPGNKDPLLAEHWRQKAKECERLPAPPLQPFPQLPLPEIADDAILPTAPAIAARDAQLAPQPPAQSRRLSDSFPAGGDDWKRLLADIRGR
jgi:hypothetical protein